MDSLERISVLREILYEQGHQTMLLLAIVKRKSRSLSWPDLEKKLEASQEKTRELLKNL